MVDSKLNVTGGVLSRFVVEVDRIADLLLVVLTQAETDNPDHLINVEIRPPSGDEPQYLRVSSCPQPQPAVKSDSPTSGSN